MSKKIIFNSDIDHNGDTQTISFESAVTIDNYDDFKTYEFKEPNMNVLNRIEIADEKVNIFAGPSSINLELEKTIKIEYNTPQGTLFLDSYLIDIDKTDESNISFTYTLSQNGSEVGKYKITLQIID